MALTTLKTQLEERRRSLATRATLLDGRFDLTWLTCLGRYAEQESGYFSNATLIMGVSQAGVSAIFTVAAEPTAKVSVTTLPITKVPLLDDDPSVSWSAKPAE